MDDKLSSSPSKSRFNIGSNIASDSIYGSFLYKAQASNLKVSGKLY